MSANKFKIRIDEIGDVGYVKIPISLDFNQAGQEDIINREFVDVEVEKSINPIVDYEKVRFTPITTTTVNSTLPYTIDVGDILNNLTYKLNFLNEGGTPSTTYYGDIGFIDDDIKFRKNKFLNSFLKLSFYDSDINTDQNLVSIITIFSKVTFEDVDSNGLSKHANNFEVKFKLQNPITTPKGFAEGYYLYHFKSEMIKNSIVPKYLYMKAEFNNASDGTVTKFITTTDKLPINELMSKLHVKYELIRSETGFYYKLGFDSDHITQTSNDVVVDLFEIQVQ